MKCEHDWILYCDGTIGCSECNIDIEKYVKQLEQKMKIAVDALKHIDDCFGGGIYSDVVKEAMKHIDEIGQSK